MRGVYMRPTPTISRPCRMAMAACATGCRPTMCTRPKPGTRRCVRLPKRRSRARQIQEFEGSRSHLYNSAMAQGVGRRRHNADIEFVRDIEDRAHGRGTFSVSRGTLQERFGEFDMAHAIRPHVVERGVFGSKFIDGNSR